MAKRSYSKRSSVVEKEEEEEVLLPLETHSVTTLVLMKDIGTLNVIGSVTGKTYTWHGAGSKVDVDDEDVEEILKRKNTNMTNCCDGSTSQQPYFKVLE
jgi:hypothetical protein